MRNQSSRIEGGFTLVEVILAILIICGIMTVLLYFYQRSAEVRLKALEETEFISTGRLLMEQITGELRTARLAEEQFLGLKGSSNSISFVCTGLPAPSRWLVNTNEPARSTSATDLKKIYYGMAGGTNLFSSRGIERREQFLITSGPVLEPNLEGTIEEALVDIPLTNAVTNLAARTDQPLTDKLKFLQFRYWDGKEWVDNWGDFELPGGVEISLGREAMPPEAGAEGYPFEIFRRVVFLPQSHHPANRAAPTNAVEEFPL